MQVRNHLLAGFLAYLAVTSCTGPAGNGPAGITVIPSEDIREITQPETDELAVSREYIPLETGPECLVGDGCQLRYHDGRFFIVTSGWNSKEKLLVFGRDGKFLNQIGRPGNGPQEYTTFSQFAIDEQKNEAVIVDGYGQKILRFDFAGNFISESPLHDDDLQFSRGIYMLDDGRYLSVSSVFLRPMPMYTLYSPKLDSSQVIREMGYTWIGSRPFAGRPVSRHDGQTLMLAPLNDTVYRLDNGAMAPAYVLTCRNRGKTWDNPEGIPDYEKAREKAGEAGFTYPYGILENDRYLLFQYPESPILWDKRTGKGVASEFGYYVDSLKNTPLSLLSLIAAEGDTFIGMQQAYNFLSESEEILANNPGLETLKETITAMKEDDNPVIIVYRMK